MTNSEHEYLEVTEEVVHTLAQRVQALDAAARRLIVSDAESNLGGRFDLQRDSIYRMFKWRCQVGSISALSLAELSEITLREIDHFGALILNLVGFFSRGAELIPRKRHERIGPILEEVIDLFDFLAEEKGVEIRLQVIGDPSARVDRELVHRLLVNLCDNAVKYSYKTSGESSQRFIAVSCRRHSVDGSVIISISSYGVGVLEEEISSGAIYEYGVRGRLARDRERRGMGIGLAESKRIAEAHGGSLSLKSEKRHGETYLTTVQVLLPYN